MPKSPCASYNLPHQTHPVTFPLTLQAQYDPRPSGSLNSDDVTNSDEVGVKTFVVKSFTRPQPRGEHDAHVATEVVGSQTEAYSGSCFNESCLRKSSPQRLSVNIANEKSLTR